MRCILVDRDGFVKEIEVPADEVKRIISIPRSTSMSVPRASNYVENAAPTPGEVVGWVQVQFVLVGQGMHTSLYEER